MQQRNDLNTLHPYVIKYVETEAGYVVFIHLYFNSGLKICHRIFRSYGMQSYFLPSKKIKQILWKPKDLILSQETCGVFHKMECAGSGEIFVWIMTY